MSANRLDGYFGKDSPDIPDHKVARGERLGDGLDDINKIMERCDELRKHVRDSIQFAIDPTLMKAGEEHGPVTLMAAALGIAECFAGTMATIAKCAGLADGKCEGGFKRIMADAMKACNGLTMNVLQDIHGLSPDDLTDIITRAAERGENPEGLSMTSIMELMKTPRPKELDKDDLKDLLRRLMDTLDDEGGDDDSET